MALRHALGIVAASAAALVAVSAPALAAPGDHIDNPLLSINALNKGSVEISTTCPSDPPQKVIVTFPGENNLVATEDITCNGASQTLTVDFNTCFAAGTDHFVRVTISGDGGEITDEGTYTVEK